MKAKYLVILAGVIAAALVVFFVGYTSVLNNSSSGSTIVKTSSEIKPFTTDTIDGKQYAFTSTETITVFEVFASWCLPCRTTVPEARKFAIAHDDVDVVGVAYRDVIPEIEKFEKEYGKFDTTIKATGKVEDSLGIRSIPQTLFVINGKVHYRIYGGASEKDLENVLSLVKGELASSKQG